MSLCLATAAETAMSADMVVYAGDNDMLDPKHYHTRTNQLLHSRKADQLCVRVVIHAQLRRLFRDATVQERLRPYLVLSSRTAQALDNGSASSQRRASDAQRGGKDEEGELQQLLSSAKLRSQFFARKQQELQRAIMASEEQQRLKSAHGLLASWERENAVLLRHPMFMSYIPSHALLLESAATVALYKRYARLAEGGYSSEDDDEDEGNTGENEDHVKDSKNEHTRSVPSASHESDTSAAMLDSLHRLSGKPVPRNGADAQTTWTLFTESTRPFRVDVHNKMFSHEVLQNKRVEYEQMRENVARLRQNLERCGSMHTLQSFIDLRDELFCEFGLDKLFAVCVQRDAELSEVYEGSYAASIAAAAASTANTPCPYNLWGSTSTSNRVSAGGSNTNSNASVDSTAELALSCRVAQYSMPAIVAACYRNYMYTLFTEDWDVMIHKHVAQQQQQQQQQQHSELHVSRQRRRCSDESSISVAAASTALSNSGSFVHDNDHSNFNGSSATDAVARNRRGSAASQLLDDAGVSDSDAEDGLQHHQARLALRRSVGVLRDRDTFTYWLLSCLTADATLTGPNNMVGKSRTTVKDYEKYWLPPPHRSGSSNVYVPSINGNSRTIFARTVASGYGLPYLVALCPVRYHYRENNDPNTIQSGVIDLVVYDATNEKVLLMVQTAGEGESRMSTLHDILSANNGNDKDKNDSMVNRAYSAKVCPRRTRATAFLTAQEERYRFAAVVRSAITDDNAYHGFTCQGKVAEYFFDPEFGPEENFYCVMAPLRVSQRTAAEVTIPVTAFRDFTRCPPRYYIFSNSVIVTGGENDDGRTNGATMDANNTSSGSNNNDDAEDGISDNERAPDDCNNNNCEDNNNNKDKSDQSRRSDSAPTSRVSSRASTQGLSSCSVNFGHVELQELAMDLSDVIPDNFTEAVVLPQLHTRAEAERKMSSQQNNDNSININNIENDDMASPMHRVSPTRGRTSSTHLQTTAQDKHGHSSHVRSVSPSMSNSNHNHTQPAMTATSALRRSCALTSTRSLRYDREDCPDTLVALGDALEQVRAVLLQHAHRWPVPSFVVRRTRAVEQNASLRAMLQALREGASARADSSANHVPYSHTNHQSSANVLEESNARAAERTPLTPHAVFRELLSRRHGVALSALSSARSPRIRSSAMSSNSSYASR